MAHEAEDSTWMKGVIETVERLIRMPEKQYVSIYRVPHKLRSLKEDAYTPQLVCIGPFHRNNPKFRVMDEHKWRYMINFIGRGGSPTRNQIDTEEPGASTDVINTELRDIYMKCMAALSEYERVVRECYAETIDMDKHQLVEMLLVDGCFLLQLFIKHFEEEKIVPDQSILHQHDFLFGNSWMITTLKHDLALLENQIPFFILQELFNFLKKSNDDALEFNVPLHMYVLHFFRSTWNMIDEYTVVRNGKTFQHLLEMLHHVYMPTIPKIQPTAEGQQISLGFNRCATDLFKYSGIRFQASIICTSLMDIEYNDGLLTIPKLVINKSSDSILRNLIAFEQGSIGRYEVTSYATLVSGLIKTQKDVEFLKRANILVIDDGGQLDVSSFFKSLCREVVLKDFYFAELCEKVNNHHSFPLQLGRVTAYYNVEVDGWKESFAALKQEYFHNRWSFIAFLAAALVILLAGLQTFYTVRSYYTHKM